MSDEFEECARPLWAVARSFGREDMCDLVKYDAPCAGPGWNGDHPTPRIGPGLAHTSPGLNRDAGPRDLRPARLEPRAIQQTIDELLDVGRCLETFVGAGLPLGEGSVLGPIRHASPGIADPFRARPIRVPPLRRKAPRVVQAVVPGQRRGCPGREGVLDAGAKLIDIRSQGVDLREDLIDLLDASGDEALPRFSQRPLRAGKDPSTP